MTYTRHALEEKQKQKSSNAIALHKALMVLESDDADVSFKEMHKS